MDAAGRDFDVRLQALEIEFSDLRLDCPACGSRLVAETEPSRWRCERAPACDATRAMTDREVARVAERSERRRALLGG
jgi:ribosomal protein L37AE/L43A